MRAALRCHDVDRLARPLLRQDACGPQVVEPAEHVVVVALRVAESDEHRIDHLAGRTPTEQPALQQVLLPALTSRGDPGARAGGALVLEQALEDVDGRME